VTVRAGLEPRLVIKEAANIKTVQKLQLLENGMSFL
jgi:hypothetical protein